MSVAETDRLRMVRDGLVAPEAILCETCGRPLLPGQRVLCGDGYTRAYGEFVLEQRDGLHEDNRPIAHGGCDG